MISHLVQTIHFLLSTLDYVLAVLIPVELLAQGRYLINAASS